MTLAKEKFLASTGTHGQFAGIPIAVDIVNAVNKTAPMRKLLNKALGVAEKAWMPSYVNYNEPGIGNDLIALLEHNDIPYEIVDKEQCCGMPKLELGDLDAVERAKDANIPVLARCAREGWAILSAIPRR